MIGAKFTISICLVFFLDTDFSIFIRILERQPREGIPIFSGISFPLGSSVICS